MDESNFGGISNRRPMADINTESHQQSVVRAFDEVNQSFKATITNPEDMIQSDITDSTKLGDGSGANYVGVSSSGSKKGLNIFPLDTAESVLIDEVSSLVQYFGFAQAGSSTSAAVWKIKKLMVSGTVTSILFADGNNQYDNVWDNRASLSYS